MAATPTTLGLAVLVIVAVAVRARNAPEVLLGHRPRATAYVSVAGAAHVVLWQMATLAGLAVAAVAAASFGGVFSTARQEQMAAMLEPSAAARWALRYVSVLVVLVTSTAVGTAVTCLVAILQASRVSGRDVGVTLGNWSAVMGPLAHAPLAMAALAAVALAVASVLRTAPAVAAASSVGGVFALLLVQHLLRDQGDVLVPTAWFGRWLHLPSNELGVSYVWTIGSFQGGRTAAGIAVGATGACAALLGWLLVRRSGRA